MRALTGFVSVLLALSSAAAGAQTGASAAGSAAGAASGSPVNPQSTLKTYRNDTLRLSYSYPAAFTDASAVVGAAFQASIGESPLGGKDAARCITLPFSAMSTAGGQLSIVLLVRADAACLKRTFTADQLPEFTQGEVKGLSASGAKPQFGEPVSFTATGHAAEQLRGAFTLPTGDSMHAMVTCVLLKPDVVCWQLLGNTEASLRTMSAFPVSFDGSSPVMLNPPAASAQ